MLLTPTPTCPITSETIQDSHVTNDYWEYSIHYNGKKYLFRWSTKEREWKEKIRFAPNSLYIYRGMLFNQEWPIESETTITPNLLKEVIRLGEYPRNFEEKVNYSLLKAYKNGGAEYKTTKIDARNFLSSYSSDVDEYRRVIEALKSKQLIREPQNRHGEYILTEEGIKFGEHLEKAKEKELPTKFIKGKQPTIILISTKEDEFYSKALQRDLRVLDAQIILNSNLNSDDDDGSYVNSIRTSIYSSESSYVIFIKSPSSNSNPSFGSAFDIAVEVHLGTDKSNSNFIYIASVDDNYHKGRPRMIDYNTTSFDFRITSNRKRLYKSIQADWKERIEKEDKDKLGIDIPAVPITKEEEIWLKVVYEKFRNGEEFEAHVLLSKLWDKVPNSFHPNNINPVLVTNSTTLTLVGIYTIDPGATLFRIFDTVVFAIKNILGKEDRTESIGTDQILGVHPELPHYEVLLVFKLLYQYGGFANGFSSSKNAARLSITGSSEYEKFRNYKGIGALMTEIYNRHSREETESKSSEKQLDNLENNNKGEKIEINRAGVLLRDKKDIDRVLNIKEIAQEMVEIIENTPAEKGMMLGVFGKWGRGKTILLEEIWEKLNQIKIGEIKKYEKVDYHAWKYQETPASWAYLYEALAEKYYDKPKRFSFRSYKTYLIKILRLNKERVGYSAVYKLSALTVFYLASIVGVLKMDSISANILGATTVTAAFMTLISKLRSEYSTEANKLIKRYGLKHTYKDTMGLQAEIQKEIIHLIKVWVPKDLDKGGSDDTNRKIILFVEDIDRCEEEKIIQNIDSLRIMLEEEEISERIIVVAAIDEIVLKRAISSKYKNHVRGVGESLIGFANIENISKMVSEYLDKLFLSGIKLGTLSANQRDEFLLTLIKKDLQENKVYDKFHTDKKTDIEFKSSQAKMTSNGIQQLDDTTEKSYLNERLDNYNSEGQGETNAEKNFTKLTDAEVSILRECVSSWENATPRKVRVFYYRYLLGKNLLMKRYQNIGQENFLHYSMNNSLFANLIIKYTDNYNPELITEHKTLALKQNNDIIKVSMYNDKTIGRADYIEILNILEMIITY